ncbi:hypothetical protein SCLCIDRAFT_29203 [Scleroderma citrinum Foug A]|uniref:Uncharacterized protein n=1 Tax=Scleroderma citrinum Foug A TaxID=1036808 RepID=A0A0C2ZWM4_9AGAM|nr:hypothetical protein SCLCIDRAFT_29203 [Scleroderma citrinum Foug A]
MWYLRSLGCRSSWSIKDTASLPQSPPPITAILTRPSLHLAPFSTLAHAQLRFSLTLEGGGLVYIGLVQTSGLQQAGSHVPIARVPSVAAGHMYRQGDNPRRRPQSKPAGPNQSPSLWSTPSKSAVLLSVAITSPPL